MRTLDQLITREEVLRGSLELGLQDKVGEPITLQLTALKRSEMLALMRQHPTDWDARLLDRCSRDATMLDRLDFGSLADAQLACTALCLGLPEAKKREEATRVMAAELASLISSVPPVNSAPKAGTEPSLTPSASAS